MIKAVLFDNDGVLSRWGMPQPSVRRMAKQLRQQGLKTGMLSNINFLGSIYFRFWRAYDGYSPVILSCREKDSKPNLSYYKTAIERVGVEPEEILFIENQAAFLLPAQKLGMKTIHSVSNKQVLADIKKIFLEENGLKI